MRTIMVMLMVMVKICKDLLLLATSRLKRGLAGPWGRLARLLKLPPLKSASPPKLQDGTSKYDFSTSLGQIDAKH